MWWRHIQAHIYWLTRHGYEGDGVQSCEVDFLFLFTYFTISISFFASLFKVVSTPAPAKVPPPPTKSPCSLACGHNALCKVLFCLLFSFVRSSLRKLVPLKTHCFNFHSAKDVTSKQTNKCNNSCIMTERTHHKFCHLHNDHLHHNLHCNNQLEDGKTLCSCPSGYTGNPKLRCKLKTKWYDVNVTVWLDLIEGKHLKRVFLWFVPSFVQSENQVVQC